MGLLTNLLKKEAQKLASNVVSDMVSDFIPGTDTSAERSFNRGTSAPRNSVGKKTDRDGEKGLRERLEKVISQEWYGYELRREISAAELGAQSGARSYSYGLYQDGEPRAMIMILNNRNHYCRKDVVFARKACEERGIPYMNFMSHLPNRTEYISQRLRDNIL